MSDEMNLDYCNDCEKAYNDGFRACRNLYGHNWKIELQDMASFALRLVMIFIGLQVGFVIWSSMVVSSVAMKWQMCEEQGMTTEFCIANAS